jgi:ABC-type dipeptide/oligopeptide/nickel transport system permease component
VHLYIARRLAQLVPTVLGIVTLVFLMLRMLPGDPAAFIAGENVGEEALAALREQLGLTKPLGEQYIDYLLRIARFDLGQSVVTSLPVGQLINSALPVTLLIGGLSLIIGIAISVPLGTVAAYLSSRGRGLIDQSIITTVMLIDVMPSFWIGLLLMLAFALVLRWLPATGPLDFSDPAALLRRIALPVMVLSIGQLATIARITRTSVLEVMNQDYIRTSRAMGTAEAPILFRYALPNAALPVVTVAGLSFGRLLGGTIIVESIFAVPGMGTLLINGINGRDYPVVQGVVLLYATLFVLVNLITDLIYTRVDPRVRL